MKIYILMIPFIFMLFIYTGYYQVYAEQNTDTNNSIVNAMYTATDFGAIRSYQLDTINEEKLFYATIYYVSLEQNYNLPTKLELDIVSKEPYMLEATITQQLTNGSETSISRLFVLDSK